jgi:hypothetical protein
MDVCGGILGNLDTGNPCRHDEGLYFHSSMGERKIMTHFGGGYSQQKTRKVPILPRRKLQQLSGVPFEDELLLGIRTRQGFNFIYAHPIAEHVGKIGS